MGKTSATHDTLVYRLAQVLTKLNLGNSLDPQALAEEFGVSQRTIQRDLNVRFGCLPLVKSDGRYRLDEAHLGKLSLKDIDQFASLCGVNGLFPGLTERFLRHLLGSPGGEAWLVRGHHYEDLRDHAGIFEDLERAIVAHQHIQFAYAKSAGRTKDYRQLEPYRLVNQKGVWYLAAHDGEKLKSFSVTKIRGLRVCSSTFTPRAAVSVELAENDSIWLGGPRKAVVLHVDAYAADYFRRRNLVPNQSIQREFPDGALLVATDAVNQDEILPIVRYWIPHVRIQTPVEYQHALDSVLAAYLGSNNFTASQQQKTFKTPGKTTSPVRARR